jgi:DNA-binding PadR family transcriptional regulator
VPRSDQSQTAILGALSIAPMTGYALREAIRDTLGHFWSESFGQIYPALAELERNGLIERREVASGGAGKFGITAAGTARLRELLAEPPQASKPRNGLLLRLFFGAQLGPGACRELVLEAREQAEGALTQMADARRQLAGDSALAEAAPYIGLTIAAGEHSARATIAWADETLAELSRLEFSAARSASGLPLP